MPDFRIIEGSGPNKEEREKQERELEKQRAREWAKSDVERTLSGFTAALLRTMAETESIYLMRRLADFIEALNKFREVMGRGVSVAVLQEILRIPTTDLDYSDEDWRHRRWLREHGMDIVKGALRLAALKVLGREPHFGGKYSEQVIQDGIKTLEELKLPPKPQPPLKRGTASWDDVVDLGPSPGGDAKRVADKRAQSSGPAARSRKRQAVQGLQGAHSLARISRAFLDGPVRIIRAILENGRFQISACSPETLPSLLSSSTIERPGIPAWPFFFF
ncbi:hypothetical protein ACE10Z_14185 [Bradyrhizobium sp. Pha-3]|uniref:hypothetical protein n=1 Tax=Bradyrhizobium sp. Pha-3 TaxID=208375 RepID=UPI0035D4BC80